MGRHLFTCGLPAAVGYWQWYCAQRVSLARSLAPLRSTRLLRNTVFSGMHAHYHRAANAGDGAANEGDDALAASAAGGGDGSSCSGSSSGSSSGCSGGSAGSSSADGGPGDGRIEAADGAGDRPGDGRDDTGDNAGGCAAGCGDGPAARESPSAWPAEW